MCAGRFANIGMQKKLTMNTGRMGVYNPLPFKGGNTVNEEEEPHHEGGGF